MKQPMIDYTQKPKSDEFYTPEYAITPLLKYLKPQSLIWCPFDLETSNYVKVLREAGHTVIATHIDNDGKDFFKYDPNDGFSKSFDYIISNPPFSIKNQVLEHLFKLNVPFAMLMPLTTLEGVFRNKLFSKYGIQVLVLDQRVNFMEDKQSNWFNTSYFMWKVMEKDLAFEKLHKPFQELSWKK